MKDEKAKVIFDKQNVIETRKMDTAKFQLEQEKRIEELQKTFLFFQAWVKKGISRNSFLETLSYYHSFVLEPLTELIRIRYQPTKRHFGLKHIERDLPYEIIRELENLYVINSITEISFKSQQANILFFKVLKEVETKSLDSQHTTKGEKNG